MSTALVVYPKELDKLAKDRYGQPLVCSGCAHAAPGVPFPGVPSSERPCWFCVRNVMRDDWIKAAMPTLEPRRLSLLAKLGLTTHHNVYLHDATLPEKHPGNGVWYNGSRAVSVPMDAYHSADMKDQVGFWLNDKRG